MMTIIIIIIINTIDAIVTGITNASLSSDLEFPSDPALFVSSGNGNLAM